MREIEVTVKVNHSLEETIKILKDQGFKSVETYTINDDYMTLDYDNITKENALDKLKSCVLIRHLYLENNREKKMITHKQKEYENGIAISDTKINVIIDNTENAIEIFKKLGLKTIVKVSDTIHVYDKDDLSIAIEDVKGLGILLEVENENDFTGYSTEEIIKEKEKMYEELKTLNLDLDDDYDVKKAYELLLKNIEK